MLDSIAAIVQLVVWLSPSSPAKNFLLRRFGHSIGRNVRIGPNLVVGCPRFVIGNRAVISAFNVFRCLRQVELGTAVQIGSWNWFSAHPLYRNYSPDNGTLTLGAGAFITSRHYLDCSGRIDVGVSSAIGGQRSTLQTHELDLVRNCETVGRIAIGDHCFVATGCILLRDSALPPKSMLAAGSTLTKNDGTPGSSGLWGGSPARFIKPMAGLWFDRDHACDQDR